MSRGSGQRPAARDLQHSIARTPQHAAPPRTWLTPRRLPAATRVPVFSAERKDTCFSGLWLVRIPGAEMSTKWRQLLAMRESIRLNNAGGSTRCSVHSPCRNYTRPAAQPDQRFAPQMVTVCGAAAGAGVGWRCSQCPREGATRDYHHTPAGTQVQVPQGYTAARRRMQRRARLPEGWQRPHPQLPRQGAIAM